MSLAADLPVVLLGGGPGLRQRSDGDDTAKVLRPLPDGRALLLHVLDFYRRSGAREFVICAGYQARRVHELVEEEFGAVAVPSGVGGHAVRLEAAGTQVTVVDSGVRARKSARLLDAREHLSRRRFLLGYADVLSDLDLDALVREHLRGCAVLTLTATQVRSRYGIVQMGEGGRVKGFEEKPVQEALVSAGYFVAEPELFAELDRNGSFEREVLPRLAGSRGLRAYRHEGWWASLETYKDFLEVGALFDGGKPEWLSRV